MNLSEHHDHGNFFEWAVNDDEGKGQQQKHGGLLVLELYLQNLQVMHLNPL